MKTLVKILECACVALLIVFLVSVFVMIAFNTTIVTTPEQQLHHDIALYASYIMAISCELAVFSAFLASAIDK